MHTKLKNKTVKTFIHSLFFTLVSSFSLAQIVNIPDVKFKQYLINQSEINTNGDNEIQVSEAIAFTGTIECFNLGINSLAGIESFVNITSLICHQNNLTLLDLSNNTRLNNINCSDNQIVNLDFSNNLSLKFIDCQNNKLTTLTLGNNSVLSSLVCERNELKILNLMNNIGLETLWCSSNQLNSLVLPTSNLLKELACSQNHLFNVNFSNSLGLQMLYIAQNELQTLDLSNNIELKMLWAIDNKLKNLNIKNGNNHNIDFFDVTNNSELTCIQVDDVNYSETNWTAVDAIANFSTNCDAFMSIDNFSKNSIKIYPNPAKNIVHFSEQTNVEIFNSLGQKVKSEKNIKSIDVSKISKGMYFIVLKNNLGKEIQKTKIIKE